MEKGSTIYGAFSNNAMIAFLWNIPMKQVSFELYVEVTHKGQELHVNYAFEWYATTHLNRKM